MAKLNSFDKQFAEDFKADVKEQKGEIFYDKLSGISAAIIPHDKMKGFLRVYLAYCSPNEKFGRKRARLSLYNKVWNDNYILAPYSEYYEEVASYFFMLRS